MNILRVDFAWDTCQVTEMDGSFRVYTREWGTTALLIPIVRQSAHGVSYFGARALRWIDQQGGEYGN